MGTKKEVAISNLESALDGGGSRLGDLVWFSIREMEGVTRAGVNRLIANEGLYETIEEPSAWASLGYSKQSWARKRRPIQIDKEDRKRAKSPWLIVNKEGRRYDPLACVAVDEHGAFIAENIAPLPGVVRDPGANALRDDVVDELRQGFEEHFMFASRHELQSMTTTTLMSIFGGIRLKEEGGLYWVGAEMAREHDVRALSRVVGACGNSYMRVLGVNDTEENRKSVADSAREAFESEIAKAFAELRGDGARVIDESSVRASTLENRLGAYQDLRTRVELYSELLGQRREGLMAQLAEATEIVSDMLTGKTPAVGAVTR